MKVYVVVVDYRDGRDSQVYGVYKQYRHAYQEEQRLLEVSQNVFNSEIKVRILGPQEITE